MDGGVEGGFLCEPSANNPAFRGHAFWEPDDFEQVVEHARQAASCSARIAASGSWPTAHTRISWGSAPTCWTARLTTCRHSSPR